jgi:curved DNA-binding protein CbpA
MKSHYEILGLEPDATFEDIKKAYRKLSLKFHPDKNQGDEYFASMFRQINDAYSVLSDAEKRRSYDHLRIRASEAERGAEALKNKERELAEREQRLRANQANWKKSFDQVMSEPVIRPRSKTDKTDGVKGRSNSQINIKTIKWSLYAVIVVLIVLIGLKDRPQSAFVRPAKQYSKAQTKQHHRKKIRSKKRYMPVDTLPSSTGVAFNKSMSKVTDSSTVPIPSNFVDTLQD